MHRKITDIRRTRGNMRLIDFESGRTKVGCPWSEMCFAGGRARGGPPVCLHCKMEFESRYAFTRKGYVFASRNIPCTTLWLSCTVTGAFRNPLPSRTHPCTRLGREQLQEHLNTSGHRNKKPDGTDAAQRSTRPAGEAGGCPKASQNQERAPRTPSCRVCNVQFGVSRSAPLQSPPFRLLKISWI
jgi:hypothetical protein